QHVEVKIGRVEGARVKRATPVSEPDADIAGDWSARNDRSQRPGVATVVGREYRRQRPVERIQGEGGGNDLARVLGIDGDIRLGVMPSLSAQALRNHVHYLQHQSLLDATLAEQVELNAGLKVNAMKKLEWRQLGLRPRGGVQ